MYEINDSNTNIAYLKEKVKQFCKERDWDQFHNPKDLAIGIVTEGAELLDIFRFKFPEEIEELLKNKDKLLQIKDELADILYFVIRFAQMNNIDLTDALLKKLEKNELKYPVIKSKGSNKKYNEV
ncbi:MAG: nucleotide pyrophosphohydrolase [Candidatus Nanopusillus acidilobi]